MNADDTIAIITGLVTLLGALAVVLRLIIHIIEELRIMTGDIVQLSERLAEHENKILH